MNTCHGVFRTSELYFGALPQSAGLGAVPAEVANSVYHVESALRAYYTAPAAFQFFEILVPLRERSARAPQA